MRSRSPRDALEAVAEKVAVLLGIALAHRDEVGSRHERRVARLAHADVQHQHPTAALDERLRRVGPGHPGAHDDVVVDHLHSTPHVLTIAMPSTERAAATAMRSARPKSAAFG